MALRYPPTHLGGHRLDGVDFTLRWPQDLFADEARAVGADRSSDRQAFLLEEAFAGPVPADALRQAAENGLNVGRRNKVLDALLANVAVLLLEKQRRPYHSRRTGASERPGQTDPLQELIRGLIRLVEEFRQGGYFDHLIVPLPCVDDGHPLGYYEEAGSFQLQQELGFAVSWPLNAANQLSQAGAPMVFDVIEVLHDHIARPRHRRYHDDGDCGWHYDEFAIDPVRRLYRWRVNHLLDVSDLGVRLAEDGEDIGRLVSTTDEARTDLLHRMTERTDSATGDRVGHAVSLFRRRGATDEDKRSACIALAGVLEERRSLLKEHLTGPDEGALFEIANRFAIRHRRADQSTAYSPVFLDWVFWAYLSTVELTDRLSNR
jgi:hypothetical protein